MRTDAVRCFQIRKLNLHGGIFYILCFHQIHQSTTIFPMLRVKLCLICTEAYQSHLRLSRLKSQLQREIPETPVILLD